MGCGAAAAKRADTLQHALDSLESEVQARENDLTRSRDELAVSRSEQKEKTKLVLNVEQRAESRVVSVEENAAQVEAEKQKVEAKTREEHVAAQKKHREELREVTIVHQRPREEMEQSLKHSLHHKDELNIELGNVRQELELSEKRWQEEETQEQSVSSSVARLRELLAGARQEHDSLAQRSVAASSEVSQWRAQAVRASEEEESVSASLRRALPELWAERVAKQSAESHVEALQAELVAARQKCTEASDRSNEARTEKDVAYHDRDMALKRRDDLINLHDGSIKELEEVLRQQRREVASELSQQHEEGSHLRTALEQEKKRILGRESRFVDLQRCLEQERGRTAELQQAMALCARSGAVRAMAAYRDCCAVDPRV